MRSWDKVDASLPQLPCKQKANTCYCPTRPAAGEDVPAHQAAGVISLLALGQEETACSPCGTSAWAVNITLTFVGTQWPVTAGLAALPEQPRHLRAVRPRQLGALRDSLPLPLGAAQAQGGGTGGELPMGKPSPHPPWAGKPKLK